ncbi:hypothetical protein NFI96_001635 [Prochilodus magdalenae]|nr:hypothetical protein NFI96_001635 [Prochilodus magdalenae]
MMAVDTFLGTVITEMQRSVSLERSYCPVEKLYCPVETLYCPVEKLYCPVETLYCPVERSYGPVETLYCPVERSYCPVERSYCTLETLYCPVERSYCPVERPYYLVETLYCPVERLSCPMERSYCPVERPNYRVETLYCPVERSYCPLERLYYPVETLYCPVERPCCPKERLSYVVERMSYPGEATYHPVERPFCPVGKLYCPVERSYCPLETLYCPVESWYCPVVRPYCPGCGLRLSEHHGPGVSSLVRSCQENMELVKSERGLEPGAICLMDRREKKYCHGVTQNGSGSSSVTSPALVLVETPNESVCGGTVVSTKMDGLSSVVVNTTGSSPPFPPSPVYMKHLCTYICREMTCGGKWELLVSLWFIRVNHDHSSSKPPNDVGKFDRQEQVSVALLEGSVGELCLPVRTSSTQQARGDAESLVVH